MRVFLTCCFLIVLSGCSFTQIMPAQTELDSAEIANKALEIRNQLDVYSEAVASAAEGEDKIALQAAADALKKQLDELWLKSVDHHSNIKKLRDKD